jgi:hypothetical protein
MLLKIISFALYTSTLPNQRQSYVATDGHSISLSWCQAPSGAQDQIFVAVSCGFVMRGSCDRRTGLSSTIAADPRQRSHSWVRIPRYSWPYFLTQIRDSPNLEGQVPVFISPRNKVAQLHPQALGSVFFVSYNSQGYDGGIRTRLHAGRNKELLYDRRFAANEFILAPNPLRITTRIIFNWTLAVIGLM